MIHAQALSIGESVHQISALIALSVNGTDIENLPTGLSLSEENDWSDEDIDSDDDFDEDDYVFDDDENEDGEDEKDEDDDWDEEDFDR